MLPFRAKAVAQIPHANAPGALAAAHTFSRE
jgi:hypothetical protein